MTESTQKKHLLDGFQDAEIIRPGLYCLDVLGDRVQTESNSEWYRLGEALVQHLTKNKQTAVLVSTRKLDYWLNKNEQSNPNNSASFKHEGRRYIVTTLDETQLTRILPIIIESGEFVFCLNVWLCFFDDAQAANARLLCQTEHTDFVLEMKQVISNLNIITQIELKVEMILAISDGIELLWFNPKI